VIHVILDNYASHKHPNVRAWLARHPRWMFHFTPTSGSWLNAVETLFPHPQAPEAWRVPFNRRPASPH
jgi:transposase